jgi:hypothetical protein
MVMDSYSHRVEKSIEAMLKALSHKKAIVTASVTVDGGKVVVTEYLELSNGMFKSWMIDPMSSEYIQDCKGVIGYMDTEVALRTLSDLVCKEAPQDIKNELYNKVMKLITSQKSQGELQCY